jgi:hypothetical protein
MTRPRLGVFLAAVAASVTLLGMPSAVAGAASAYPPPTITPTSCSFSQVVDVGTSYTTTATCTFEPGTPIIITLNGVAYSTAVAPASGIFTWVVVVTGDPDIALSGDPAVAAAFGATETFVASGTNPAGATNTATAIITIPTSAAVSSTSTTAPLAFTGADIAATVFGGVALLIMGIALTVFARRRAGRATALTPIG